MSKPRPAIKITPTFVTITVLVLAVIGLTVALVVQSGATSTPAATDKKKENKLKGITSLTRTDNGMDQLKPFNQRWYNLDQKWLGEYKLKTMHNHQIKMKTKLFDMVMALPPGATVVDCGAHIGDTGLFLKTQWDRNGRSDVKVVSIEPDSTKANFIRGMARAEKAAVRVVNAGLWDKQSKGFVVRDEDYSAMWRVREDPNGDTDFTTLDSVLAGARLDVLQLDVEGSEPQALRGAEKTIRKFNPAIFLEVETRAGKDATSREAIELLTKWGYKQTGERMDNDLLFTHQP